MRRILLAAGSVQCCVIGNELMTLRNAGILLDTPVALSSMQLTAMSCFVYVVTPGRKTQVTATIKRGQER